MKIRLALLVCVLAFSVAGFAQSGEPVMQEMPADSLVRQDLAKNAEYFSQGLEEKYNENYPQAIYNFEQALRYYNEDDASMFELSELYQQAGRSTEAFSMIEQACNLQPENKWYQIRLAQFYLQNSDYQAFMDIYDKLLEDDPSNMEYLEAYIDMLLRIGEYDKVIVKLDQLEEQVGKNEYITLQKAEIYKEQGRMDKMIEELEKLVEYIPDDTRYRALLAEAYRKTNRKVDAYKQYLKIKELEPDNQYINVSLMDYYMSIGDTENAFREFVLAIKNPNLDYETKAQIYEIWSAQNEKSKDGLKVSHAVEVGQAFIQTYPEKNIGYYIMGVSCMNMNDYRQAKSYFHQAVEKDNTNFASLYQLTFCDVELNEYKDVIEDTQKALSLYPEQPLFYLFQGIAFFNLKDYEDCVTTLEKGRKLSANRDLTKNFDIYIGDAYNQMGNKQKTYDAYDRVLRADPDNIYVLNNYAYYLSLDNKDLELALQMSEKTIKAEPKNAVYLDTYAWVLYKSGRYPEAKKYMEKVFKYDKNPQGINYEHYGDILFKLGDTKGAVKNWKKAVKAGGEVSEFLEQKIKDEKLYE